MARVGPQRHRKKKIILGYCTVHVVYRVIVGVVGEF